MLSRLFQLVALLVTVQIHRKTNALFLFFRHIRPFHGCILYLLSSHKLAYSARENSKRETKMTTKQHFASIMAQRREHVRGTIEHAYLTRAARNLVWIIGGVPASEWGK